MLRALIIMVCVASTATANADELTVGAMTGAAFGTGEGADGPGLFVHGDGVLDWHPSPSVALGAQAQLWTINTTWEDLLARITLSTDSSASTRLYIRGGAGGALMHSDIADPSSHLSAGLAYAFGAGILIAAGRSWDIDIELRYSHFQGSSETAPDGYLLDPWVTVVGIGVGFDANVL